MNCPPQSLFPIPFDEVDIIEVLTEIFLFFKFLVALDANGYTILREYTDDIAPKPQKPSLRSLSALEDVVVVVCLSRFLTEMSETMALPAEGNLNFRVVA